MFSRTVARAARHALARVAAPSTFALGASLAVPRSRLFASAPRVPTPTDEFVPLRPVDPSLFPTTLQLAAATTYDAVMSVAVPVGTHAPGVADPSAAVAARKAARPAAMETLAKCGPVSNVTTVTGTTTTVAAATLTVALAAAAPADAAASVVFVTSAQFDALDVATKAILSAQGFKGAAKTVAATVGASAGQITLYAGLGAAIDGVSTSATEYLSLNTLRGAIYTAVSKAKELKAASLALTLPTIPVTTADSVPVGAGQGVKPPKPAAADADAAAEKPVVPIGTPAAPASADEIVDAAVRMVVTGNWRWDKYWKAETSKEKNHPLGTVTIVSAAAAPVAASQTAFANAVAVSESLLFAREFGNERADILHPAAAEELAAALVAANSDVMKLRVLQYDELLAQGFNLITSVGQGATVLPRLVAIEYNPLSAETAAKREFVSFVGKGLCFDTGGLNLKPTGAMETMYMDKCGAAAVIGTMRALATVRPAVKVVGVLALAENAIDAKAYKPYAVIDSHAGSVQVGNTDAEGRLCLADALTFVQNEYKPTHIVDVATLTGACVIALGEHCAGLFGNSDVFAEELTAAGTKHHERLWRLPLFPEHAEDIAGEDSDLSSTGRTRYAGASTAATFLEKYIQPGVEWSHLDIAGPASASAPRGYLPKNATGFGMQTLFEYALSKAE